MTDEDGLARMRFLADALLLGFLASLIAMGTAIAQAVTGAVSETDLLELILNKETGIITLLAIGNVVFFRGWRESERKRAEDAKNYSDTLLEQQGVLQKVSFLLDRVDRERG